MSNAPELVICTANPHKVEEYNALLAGSGLAAVPAPHDLPAVEETGRTYAANALLKARSAAAVLEGRWLLADDSGLAVEFLVGEPGVKSARYAGRHATDEDNNRRLLDELAGVPASERAAKFTCVIALVSPGGVEHTYRGEITGRIGEVPAGEGGFGYDPLFVPDGHTETFAELDAAEKHRISHRARAVAAMVADAPWN